MEKREIIKRHGEGEYVRRLQQSRDWAAQHREEENAKRKKRRGDNPEEAREWRAANQNKVKAHNQENNRKGGKRYDKKLLYMRTGIPGERQRVRAKHASQYYPFKQLIAPNSQIHHEWILGTADFRGVALVEKDQHMHGYIDVIKILEGEILLLTEKEIRGD